MKAQKKQKTTLKAKRAKRRLLRLGANIEYHNERLHLFYFTISGTFEELTSAVHKLLQYKRFNYDLLRSSDKVLYFTLSY